MNKKIKLTRILDADKVRDMCIRYRHYTRGDNEAYSKMLLFADKVDADNTEDMYKVAKDIYEHSTIAETDTDYTEDELVAGIMYGLYNECTYTLVDIED